jgi:hypothetical protein
MSGSTVSPRGTSSRTTSCPHACVIPANRSPNAPPTRLSARPLTAQRAAISMNPVAEQVPISTRREV